LNENFGFSFAEDQVENTPNVILGEANLKAWVNSVDPNNMLNRQVRYASTTTNHIEFVDTSFRRVLAFF
jgi:hypothetical protein